MQHGQLGPEVKYPEEDDGDPAEEPGMEGPGETSEEVEAHRFTSFPEVPEDAQLWCGAHQRSRTKRNMM